MGLNKMNVLGSIIVGFFCICFAGCGGSGGNGGAQSVPSPKTVTAVGGNGQVNISWIQVPEAASYTIYWATVPGVTQANGNKISGVSTPYTQTGLASNTAYYYIITAVNSAGESVASAQTTATTNPPPVVIPATPTGVTATGGTQQVTLSWFATSGAISYNIYYSIASGVTIANGTKITGATSPYALIGLLDGTAYYYIITAVNSTGESVASAQASATTVTPAPVFNALSFYNSVCLGCHYTLGVRTAAQITTAIATIGPMMSKSSVTSLTSAQIAAIAAVSY